MQGLNKSFGDKHVVKDFSIQVPRGRITGFLGPNGSGKTTTLRMLCGLLTPDSGEGKCLGLDIVKQADAIKLRVGYMTQKFSLYDDLTIEENLMFMARVHGLDHRERAGHSTRSTAWASTSAASSWPASSRAAGSSAWRWPPPRCTNPNSCCSTSPPPASTRRPAAQFWDEIHALSAQGLTVLVSTHYMDEAERCHDIAYIAYGELMARGTAEEILNEVGLVTFEGEGPGVDRLSPEIAASCPASKPPRPSASRSMSAGRTSAALDSGARALSRARPSLDANRSRPWRTPSST